MKVTKVGTYERRPDGSIIVSGWSFDCEGGVFDVGDAARIVAVAIATQSRRRTEPHALN